MTPNAMRVLLIEDEDIQRLFTSRRLSFVDDVQFTFTVATTENEAMATFPGGGFELVVLDYHLDQGNGVSCLRRIRQLDLSVPIVVLSSVASEEIAAELMSRGADDYLDKAILGGGVLRQSVWNVLARAKAFPHRFATLVEMH